MANGARSRLHRGAGPASDLLARLTQAEFREAVRFSDEEVAVLNEMAAGRPPRNAAAILKAMELKASYAYSRPKQDIGVSGEITVEIVRYGQKKEE